ncbi:hypothetical protein, partial [Mycobacteroides abscessus]|uniref:hypothetical protein n=1 Tax=Mycobacteroides abscessus TaxID=36809 RepID=UPI000A90938E
MCQQAPRQYAGCSGGRGVEHPGAEARPVLNQTPSVFITWKYLIRIINEYQVLLVELSTDS